MGNRNLFLLVIFTILIFIAACGVQQQNAVNTAAAAPKPEAQQPYVAPSTGQKQEISPDVKELLDKSKARVQNIYYKYSGPETGTNFYEFYVKGDKIKYLPYREIKALDRPEFYNSVYIDMASKTAQSYCDDRACIYKGKKADLSYNSAYVLTIFDWVGRITQASKAGEEVIDDRSTWKVDTNEGIFWLDAFYGIPLKIQSKGNIFRFQQLNVNGVHDSDVIPP